MIKLNPKPLVPSILRSKEVAHAKAHVAEKISNRDTITKKDFKSYYWRKDKVRLTLWKHHNKKCCYCERIRDPKREPDIEHFRPKTRIHGEDGPGYWWLAYEWDNLFFSCKKCNQTKGTHFPERGGNRASDPCDSLDKENPVLPHPVNEDPEQIISFHWEFVPLKFVYPIGIDSNGRGNEAIKILGLDTKDLAEERGHDLTLLLGLAKEMHCLQVLHKFGEDKSEQIAATAEEIRNQTKSDKQFAGFRRAFFRLQGLGEYVSTD